MVPEISRHPRNHRLRLAVRGAPGLSPAEGIRTPLRLLYHLHLAALQNGVGRHASALGRPALPWEFVAAGQSNAIVPYGLPVNRPLQLLVAANGSYALPETVLRIRPPAIFTQNETGSGPGAICAGLGDVIPAVSAGSAAPVSTLSRTVNPVAVTIGGQPAQVSFAGLAPGFAGLYQVNAVAPSGIAPAANVPVILSAAGASSPPVTVAL